MTQHKRKHLKHQRGCRQTKGKESYLIHTLVQQLQEKQILRHADPWKLLGGGSLGSSLSRATHSRRRRRGHRSDRKKLLGLVNVSGYLLSLSGRLHPAGHSCISHSADPSLTGSKGIMRRGCWRNGCRSGDSQIHSHSGNYLLVIRNICLVCP